jgi:hypothetical protein
MQIYTVYHRVTSARVTHEAFDAGPHYHGQTPILLDDLPCDGIILERLGWNQKPKSTDAAIKWHISRSSFEGFAALRLYSSVSLKGSWDWRESTLTWTPSAPIIRSPDTRSPVSRIASPPFGSTSATFDPSRSVHGFPGPSVEIALSQRAECKCARCTRRLSCKHFPRQTV